MQDTLVFDEGMSHRMTRRRRLRDHLGPVGIFDIELIRKGKIIVARREYNAITNAGKNNLLNRFFNQTGTNTNLWYFGLINGTAFSGTNTSDTMITHSGWTEFEDYTGNRKDWGQGTATGQQIASSAPISFTFTNPISTDLYGAFMCSDSTKGGNDGLLWNSVPFNAILPVEEDDVLNCSYQIQL